MRIAIEQTCWRARDMLGDGIWQSPRRNGEEEQGDE